MRKTELVVSGEVICPKTKASIVGHEQTNIEAYLDQQNRTSSTITQSSAMSQVGLGDDADLSFCVQDGFYESATLYGKTLVNCIQEPSSQDVVLPYAFEDGQYVTINDTKESGALGVELKGQTLVNIHKRQEYKLGRSTETIASNKFENIVAEENRISFDMVDNLTYGWGSFVNGGELDLDILKPNTKYLVYFGTASFPDYFGVSFRNGDSTSLICTQAQVNKGANYAIVTTTNEIIKNKQIIYISIPQQCVGHYEFKDIKIIEYQQGMENWDFPYFEGMTSCQMPNLHSVNQMFDYSRATTPPGGTSTSFSNDRKNLKVSFETSRNCNQNNVGTLPIGTYEVSYEIRGYVEGKSVLVSRAGIVFPNSSETWWDTSTSVTKHFKDMSTGEYTKVTKTIVVSEPVTITIIYHAWGDNAIGWCEFRNIRIVPQGKSSTLSLPEEVALRSLPNGVKDTLNLNTGEYVKRIGERVFHGTEKGWKYRNLSNNGEIAVFSANTGDGVGIEDWKIVRDAQNETVACDSFLTHQERSGIANISALNKECFAYFLDSYGVKFIYIAINKNKASDLAKLKSYLASNPITVQYQLETPIVTRINLPSTLKSWNTTTHIYSEIPEDTLYPILSHSNPSYPVILKPSTKYSIVANSYSNSHTNSAISFNLGGATASAAVGHRVTTVTTPSTLTSEELVMSGRGNKLNHVMLIEGDVVGDEPYFEGICDSRSPILSNVGKNLFDTDGEWVKCSYSHGVPCITATTPVITVNNDGFSITTNDNHYNSGFGQYINVSSLDTLYVRATAIYTDTKTVPELRIIGLYENEGIPVKIDSANSSDFKGTTKTFSGSEQEVSFSLDVSSYSKIFIMFSGGWKSEMSGSYVFTMKDVYIGSSNQTYEPYKSNTATFDQKDGKTIVLRSLPNGVCDTLNVETGEYVQRVGECRLDGSSDEDWSILTYPPYTNGTHYQFKYFLGTNLIGGEIWTNAQVTISDTLPSQSGILHWNGTGGYGIGGDVNYFMITWEKQSSPFTDIATLRAWLSQNPTTIQYILATPIVSTIDVQGFPYAYKDGHVQLTSGHSGDSLTPKLEYVVQTNRSGAIQANQDRLVNHEKRLVTLEAMVLHQLIQLEYHRAKHTFLSQTRQVFEGEIQMYHTKYDLLSEFIEKKLYRSLEEVFEMLDVYFMLGDLTDGEYDNLYEMLMPSQGGNELPEEDFDYEYAGA